MSNPDPNHADAMPEKTKKVKDRVWARNWRVGLETLVHIPILGEGPLGFGSSKRRVFL